MPRKQRFKPSRKPKPAVEIPSESNVERTSSNPRDDVGEAEPTRQEARGPRAVIETDEANRSPTDTRAVIDDVGSEAGT